MEHQRYMIAKRDAGNKAYTVVTIIGMVGKKIFFSTDQCNESVYKGQEDTGVSINLVPIKQYKAPLTAVPIVSLTVLHNCPCCYR